MGDGLTDLTSTVGGSSVMLEASTIHRDQSNELILLGAIVLDEV